MTSEQHYRQEDALRRARALRDRLEAQGWTVAEIEDEQDAIDREARRRKR